MKVLDNRGLNCPEPLIRTRKALQKAGELITLVDSEAARENILRYAKSNGFTASWETKDNCHVITITGPTGSEAPENKIGETETDLQLAPQPGDLNHTVIMISGDSLGQGEKPLGDLLMKNFIFTLAGQKPFPCTIILINSGVKLSSYGSPVLEELGKLEQTGVKIISCGTCLDYYKLTGKLAVGEITNMYDLVEIMASSSKVISI